MNVREIYDGGLVVHVNTDWVMSDQRLDWRADEWEQWDDWVDEQIASEDANRDDADQDDVDLLLSAMVH